MNDCESITVTEFYLTPFSTSRINEILIFIGFLLVYTLAVVGNLIIIVLVCTVPQLHTPMYFFLCNLSSVDVIYVSTILPKMLSIIITGDKTIFFLGCFIQLSFFIFCANADIYILTCMAYDRYVAICSPLHYPLIITRKVCFTLATFYMILSVVNSVIFTLLISTLSFCSSQKIDHFFCEVVPLMKLSSSDTKRIKVTLLMEDICVAGSLTFILISYIRIISTVVKIRSSKGQLKALSSCSSHIITVLLYFGPSIFMYMKPESEDSKEEDEILSMLFVAVVPMLNPFVYSLRNKDVLGAARKMANLKGNRIALLLKNK
ncbi:olfactory receptor 5AR1-like [Eleutherodactylus coqui]|uniref:olfactory receptor 5AR1-like n=1 Tax=Eleutherodactylus coqui TaxID=57060 RepID=UPI003462BDD2